MSTIGEKAARSSAVLMIRRVVGYAIRFGVMAVLARKLDVGAFGIVAIASTAIGMMTVFRDAGINTWVISDRAEGWEERAKSAWWLNLALTSGQCVIASALVPVAVLVYEDRILIPVFAIVIATFFIEQMRVVPDALLARRMEFKALAARELAYDVLTGVGGIGMALAGMGLWSLVVPRVVLAPVFFLLSLRLANWTPGKHALTQHWRGIYRYSLPLIGSDLLHTLANDGDTMIVGRVLGKASVAFYNAAYQLANIAGRNITAVLVLVSTPTLAKLKESSGDLGPVCIRMYRVIALITMPFLAGMFAVSDDLILLVYGPKWAVAGTLLQVFTIFTLVRAVTSPSGAIFNVAGRTDMTLKMYLLLLPLMALGVGLGCLYGVVGVAIGVTIARIISGTISFSISLVITNARIVDGFRGLVAPLVTSAAMATIVSLLRFELHRHGIHLAARLAVCVPLGVVLYPAILRAVSRAAFDELLSSATKVSPVVKRVIKRFRRTGT